MLVFSTKRSIYGSISLDFSLDEPLSSAWNNKLTKRKYENTELCSTKQ